MMPSKNLFRFPYFPLFVICLLLIVTITEE